ncbi:hypothetical protein CRE_27025 [Caenorhabditis remanei]|uniref:Uncharacterized protein n=1 Tax=Caenorhabditis remanei TaxID=31234 RepID=E3LPU4_CAERE|nr:hypothetical protein CRE_27025 [Caenorhabditis remanei]
MSSRRYSTWLSLSIAVIRTMVIRNLLDPKIGELSKPISTIYCVLIVSLVCLPVSCLGCFKYRIIPSYPTYCDTNNSTSTGFMTAYSLLFTEND